MDEEKETVIGDVTYRVAKLPFKPWKQNLLRLGQVIGPSLGALMDGSDIDELKGGKAGSAGIREALGLLFNTLTESQLDAFAKPLAEMTIVQKAGEEPFKLDRMVDAHFSNYQEHYFQWLVFATRAQYEAFFKEVGSLAGALGIKKGR